MAEGVEPTEDDVSIARQGVMTQLRAHCGDIDVPGLDAFIENQVQVIASERAYTRHLHKILHKDL